MWGAGSRETQCIIVTVCIIVILYKQPAGTL